MSDSEKDIKQIVDRIVELKPKAGRIVVTDENGVEVPVEVRIEQTIDFGAAVQAAKQACTALATMSSEQRALAMHIAMRVCLAELVATCTCTCGETHDEAWFLQELYRIEQQHGFYIKAVKK